MNKDQVYGFRDVTSELAANALNDIFVFPVSKTYRNRSQRKKGSGFLRLKQVYFVNLN